MGAELLFRKISFLEWVGLIRLALLSRDSFCFLVRLLRSWFLVAVWAVGLSVRNWRMRSRRA